MRLSVEKTDKGYRPDAHKFDVYLDGVKLNDCITADDVLGEAIVYARDERGRLIVEWECIQRKTVSGVITFNPQPEVRE